MFPPRAGHQVEKIDPLVKAPSDHKLEVQWGGEGRRAFPLLGWRFCGHESGGLVDRWGVGSFFRIGGRRPVNGSASADFCRGHLVGRRHARKRLLYAPNCVAAQRSVSVLRKISRQDLAQSSVLSARGVLTNLPRGRGRGCGCGAGCSDIVSDRDRSWCRPSGQCGAFPGRVSTWPLWRC